MERDSKAAINVVDALTVDAYYRGQRGFDNHPVVVEARAVLKRRTEEIFKEYYEPTLPANGR